MLAFLCGDRRESLDHAIGVVTVIHMRRPTPQRALSSKPPKFAAAPTIERRFLYLQDDQCRWITGQDGNGNLLSCGEAVKEYPYCEIHDRLSKICVPLSDDEIAVLLR